MDEAEWLRCDDPTLILEFLHTGHRAEHRKLRLFLVACCRGIWHLLDEEAYRRAVELTERFIGGRGSKADLLAAAEPASRAAWTTRERWYGSGSHLVPDDLVPHWHPAVAAAEVVARASSPRRFSWSAW